LQNGRGIFAEVAYFRLNLQTAAFLFRQRGAFSFGLNTICDVIMGADPKPAVLDCAIDD